MGIGLLDRYVAGQMVQAVLYGLILFLVLWLAPETLFKLTHALFDGQITLVQYLQLVALTLPETLENAIPMSAFFGAIFVFRRLSLQQELISFFNAGVGMPRIAVPVVLVGLLFTGLHFAIQEWVTPATAPLYDALRTEAGMKEQSNRNFTFVEKNQAGQWDKFLIIGQIQSFLETGRLADFFILYYSPDAEGGVYISRILQAASGQWDAKANAWRLFNGKSYALNEEGVYHESQSFREQWVAMSRYPYELLQFKIKRPKDMGFLAMSHYSGLLQSGAQLQELGHLQVRLYQKLAFPLAATVFAVLGAFLGVEKTRSRNHYALVFGAVLLFVYQILVNFTTNLGGFGLMPAWVLAIIPLAVAVVMTVFLTSLRRSWES